MTTRPETMLWLSDARGVHIPRDFATSFADRSKNVSGVSGDDWLILEAGPDNEYYWEAWTDVCDNAIVTDDIGNKYNVYQDGDCWLIPVGMEWSEESEWFQWSDKGE